MPLMLWDNSLDIGVNNMNDEHKVLLNLMNELFDKNKENRPYEELAASLKKLADYTVKHFSDEEAFMESIHYEGIKMHKNIHKDLLAKFNAHAEKFHQKKSLDDDFFQFLKLWLTAHIKGIDTKYSAVAKAS